MLLVLCLVTGLLLDKVLLIVLGIATHHIHCLLFWVFWVLLVVGELMVCLSGLILLGFGVSLVMLYLIQ